MIVQTNESPDLTKYTKYGYDLVDIEGITIVRSPKTWKFAIHSIIEACILHSK